jgi:hypothetical protein
MVQDYPRICSISLPWGSKSCSDFCSIIIAELGLLAFESAIRDEGSSLLNWELKFIYAYSCCLCCTLKSWLLINWGEILNESCLSYCRVPIDYPRVLVILALPSWTSLSSSVCSFFSGLNSSSLELMFFRLLLFKGPLIRGALLFCSLESLENYESPILSWCSLLRYYFGSTNLGCRSSEFLELLISPALLFGITRGTTRKVLDEDFECYELWSLFNILLIM